MSYDKVIKSEGYEVLFEYSYDHHEQKLKIDSWDAWEGNKQILIADVSVSEAIEKDINNWLKNEFENNAHNYEDDYLDCLFEQRNI